MEYDKNQRRAIEHFNGPALVLAGPGSGKTSVIVERVKALIEKRTVAQESILVVTFTKAAAREMEERFRKAITQKKGTGQQVTFGTFHSVFLGILKSSSRFHGKQIISDGEKVALLKQCLVSLKISYPTDDEYLANLWGEIAKVKGSRRNITENEEEVFGRIFSAYEKALYLENKMDFEDILQETYELLQKNENVRKKWQMRYSYVLVDEFQDINEIQYDIIRLLSKPQNNIFVVGDEDQSIYGFRGANPEFIFRFQRDYPEVTLIVLNVNYRCTGAIVEQAKRLIQKNRIRVEKEICANNDWGQPVDFRQFKNQGEELEGMIRQIERIKKQGYRNEEIAILVRNNHQIPVIIKALQNNGYQGNTRKFHGVGGSVFQDIYFYMIAALDGTEGLILENRGLLKILNKPPRLFSREVILREGMTWERLRKHYRHCPEAVRQLEELKFSLSMIKNLPPYGAIHFIRKGLGYEDYLRAWAKERKIPVQNLLKQLEWLQNQSRSMKSLQQWIEWQERCRSDTTNVEKGIRLLTMHGAKGLEFPVVFLPDSIQGVIPSKVSIREGNLEEERRLFYVAMTRAKEKLYIWGVREQLGTTVQMSVFVDEILSENEIETWI